METGRLAAPRTWAKFSRAGGWLERTRGKFVRVGQGSRESERAVAEERAEKGAAIVEIVEVEPRTTIAQ